MTLNLIIYTVAVATFLSVWTGLDLMFKSTDIFPDGVGFNGLICYVRNFHYFITFYDISCLFTDYWVCHYVIGIGTSSSFPLAVL